MGKIKVSSQVRLICGMITQDEGLFERASQRMIVEFGPIDYRSKILSFDHTDYYQAEMGPNLKRRFVSFKELIDRERLSEIKCFTNTLEEEFSEGERRQMNLDPGYLTLDKLVLATTKDYSHRIYIGRGIYAEVTLHYQNREWRPYEWTYPDYRSKEYLEIFKELRSLAATQGLKS